MFCFKTIFKITNKSLISILLLTAAFLMVSTAEAKWRSDVSESDGGPNILPVLAAVGVVVGIVMYSNRIKVVQIKLHIACIKLTIEKIQLNQHLILDAPGERYIIMMVSML